MSHRAESLTNEKPQTKTPKFMASDSDSEDNSEFAGYLYVCLPLSFSVTVCLSASLFLCHTHTPSPQKHAHTRPNVIAFADGPDEMQPLNLSQSSDEPPAKKVTMTNCKVRPVVLKTEVVKPSTSKSAGIPVILSGENCACITAMVAPTSQPKTNFFQMCSFYFRCMTFCVFSFHSGDNCSDQT